MEILLLKMKIFLARGLKLWQILRLGEPTMQNQFSSRTLYTIGAALTAIILTASNLHAGLFNIPSEPADWNGPFVGVHIGGVWSNYDISGYTTRVNLTKQFNEIPPPTNFIDTNTAFFTAGSHSSDDASPIGGFDLGYNKQWGHFVIGGAFGFSGSKTLDSSSFRDSQVNFITIGGTAVEADTDFRSMRRVEQVWSGYVGPQIGFAWNRFLFYATGGSAFSILGETHLDRATTTFFENIITGPAVVGPRQGSIQFGPETDKVLSSTSRLVTGWFAGGGVLFAISNKVAAGIEFKHSDYGDTTDHYAPLKSISPGATNFSLQDNEVTFKVSVLLGHLSEKVVEQTAAAAK
jgi:outer membrane immunogenic protein